MGPELYLGGRRLDLGKRIGKGGEGEVYLAASKPGTAIKFYTDGQNQSREEKVRAMVSSGLADGHSLVSFPEDIVTLKSGKFAGFTMRLFDGCRQVHELYGVKSRKTYYPKADFRFLIRAASNTARAMLDVHQSNCVIGDVNHSGILVSDNATVALIDADSFQFDASGRTYPCLVGVPDFTPPELQGKSVAGIRRTREHDNFGLAVAIFQLLFMGRHPYAGRYRDPDLTLEQFIARNWFAYSRIQKNEVSPPIGVVTLDDFPSDVADAFERAFGADTSQRPAPSEWANLLHGLEGQLSRCSATPMHFYPSAAAGCPWCRMEERSGAVLFISLFTVNIAHAPHNFDIEKAWAAIKAVAIPDIQSLRPKQPALPTRPSSEAEKAKNSGVGNKIFAIAIAILAVGLWIAVPAFFLVWLGAIVFALFRFNKTSVDVQQWQDRYRDIDARFGEAEQKWRERIGINTLINQRADLERAVEEYKGLSSAKTNALGHLGTERRSRQLHEYLDRFSIQHATISSIGPARKVTLASFGIESAADINRNAIIGVPGFGPATADKLLAWRAVHERHFVYNPAPQPSDAQAQAKVEGDFAAKAATLAKRIVGGQVELAQTSNAVRQRLAAEDSYVSTVAIQRAQLEIDLKFLGISVPSKPFSSAATVKPPSPSNNPPRTVTNSGIKCPQCGSLMIRRMARRGHRRGMVFWGCSRYPACRGTRN